MAENRSRKRKIVVAEKEEDTMPEKEEDTMPEKEENTMPEKEEDASAVAEDTLIIKDYKIWKKNISDMYRLVINHKLEWPSLTVQWLPELGEGAHESIQSVIVGTHTTNNEPNYVMVAEVLLPIEDPENDSRTVVLHKQMVHTVKQINHDGKVNRARYMPQNSSIIATKAISAEVYVFECSKHPPEPPLDGKCNPDLRLRGHSTHGYGLSWSKLKQGHLLSGSNDAQICLWDINATPKDMALDATRILKVDRGAVEDVAWHLKYENLFGSVGDDKYLHIWDLRSSRATKPVKSVMAHQSEVNCLAFNPCNEWSLATGSTDQTVKLFDLRKLSTTLWTFHSHTAPVSRVGWNPQHEEILASSCLGRRVMVWDLSRIGMEQTPKDAEDSPPELLFIHSGHTSEVSDFSWNPCEDWVVASVAADNVIQIWKMGKHYHHDKDDLKLLACMLWNSGYI